MSSHIQYIYFDQSYSPVAHSESFRINISIADIYILTYRVLYESNSFKNEKFPFMNDYVPFHYPIMYTGLKDLTPMFLSIDMMIYFSSMHECNSRINPSGIQFNRLHDAVITTLEYNKSTIDHDI